MSTFTIVFLIVLVVMIILIAVLYFLGKKAQKKQQEQQEMMEANKQSVSMFIIDKKRVKLKEAGLPQSVMAQAPKRFHNMKMPIVKAKIGPQVMSLICEEKIFDRVPVKKEVKAEISGIYLLSTKILHGKPEPVPEKKKGKFAQLWEKAQEKAGAKPLK